MRFIKIIKNVDNLGLDILYLYLDLLVCNCLLYFFRIYFYLYFNRFNIEFYCFLVIIVFDKELVVSFI